MNSLARERTKNFLVDETKIITPYRYMQRDQVKRYTDHIALYWEMDLTVIEKGLECPVEAWRLQLHQLTTARQPVLIRTSSGEKAHGLIFGGKAQISPISCS